MLVEIGDIISLKFSLKVGETYGGIQFSSRMIIESGKVMKIKHGCIQLENTYWYSNEMIGVIKPNVKQV